MSKKIKIVILVLLSIPVLFYVVLVGLIKYDEVSHQFKPNNLESLAAHSKQEHKMVLLNSGLAAFWARLDLIRNAKKSIELEYFIYDLDQSSRILTQEVLKKSKEGVKVRIIVDFSMPIFKLNPFVAAFLTKSGVEVKYYNTSSAFSLFDVQHRSHRKLLIVDGEKVITGGRNVADDYFEISEKYNFYDSDVVIEGEIVKAIQKSFDVYWNSDLAMPSNLLKTKFSDEELKTSLNYLENNKDDQSVLAGIETKGQELYKASFSGSCNDISFVSDHPGSSVAQRQVYKSLLEEARTAKKSVMVESPYFVLKTDGLEAIKNITDRGVTFKVLTNSLKSTDAYYTVSALFANIKNLSFSDIELWAYQGQRRDAADLLVDRKVSERWGLHAKRGVIDDSTTIIGTYNIDPRSANLNSELIVICRHNAPLAKAILDDMDLRMKNSAPVLQKNCLECSKNLVKGADWMTTLKFVLFIPISSRLDFLL